MAAESSRELEGEQQGQGAAAFSDATRDPIGYPRPLLLDIYEHARECYPEECCGLLLGAGTIQRAVRCTNVQDQRYARGESTLRASEGFWIDAGELEGLLRAAEQAGESLLGVYHSHTDSGPYLSHTDLEAATGPDGRPLWPGVVHLVISVRDGSVREAAVYEYDAAEGRFRGRRACASE